MTSLAPWPSLRQFLQQEVKEVNNPGSRTQCPEEWGHRKHPSIRGWKRLMDVLEIRNWVLQYLETGSLMSNPTDLINLFFNVLNFTISACAYSQSFWLYAAEHTRNLSQIQKLVFSFNFLLYSGVSLGSSFLLTETAKDILSPKSITYGGKVTNDFWLQSSNEITEWFDSKFRPFSSNGYGK